MRKFLSKLLAKLTGKPRYFPEFEWCSNNWTYNAFRLYEYIFGKAYGKNGIGDTIRCEASVQSYYDKELKETVVIRKFYTAESLIAHCEHAIREFFKVPEFGWKFVPIPQLVTPNGMQMPAFPPIFSFAIAFDNVGTGWTYDGTASSGSFAFTVTGSNPFLWHAWGSQQRRTFNDSTYNGVTMTPSDFLDSGNSSPGSYKSWFLQAPATGSNTLAWSCSGGTAEATHGAVSYSGCAQTGQLDSHSTANNFTVAANVISGITTTVANNAMVVSLVNPLGGTAPYSATLGVDNVRLNDPTNHHALGDAIKTTAGITTQTWTWTGNTNAYIFIFSIASVAASTAKGNFFNFM